MWKLLTYDHDLMMNVADIWVKLLAAGYLQSCYRQVLAGCRLIALSKHPKPGVLLIRISYALLWLTGRGLLKKCQPYFGQYFQEARPNVLQLGSGIKNAMTFMHILFSSIHHRAALQETDQEESADPIAFPLARQLQRFQLPHEEATFSSLTQRLQRTLALSLCFTCTCSFSTSTKRMEPFVEIHHFPLRLPWPSQILS